MRGFRSTLIKLICFVAALMLLSYFFSNHQHENVKCSDASKFGAEIDRLQFINSDLVSQLQERKQHEINRNVQEIHAEKSNKTAEHFVYLNPELTTNNVYYLWCGKRWFEFHHYLSVKSVLRNLRPDKIIFMYDWYPVRDQWIYNTWFEELRDEFPFFMLREIPKNEVDLACPAFMKPNLSYVMDILTKNGGLYVSEHTVLKDFPVEDRKKDLVNGLDLEDLTGFLMTKRGFPGKLTLNDVINNPKHKTKSVTCVSIAEYNKSQVPRQCVNTQLLFPKDIWETQSPFAKLARKIFYGSSKVHLPKQDYTELIPNIGHFVWLGGGKMDFLFYLGVLSLIYVANVDMVYIHGDYPPSGPYWNRISSNPKVMYVYRESPQTIYGHPVRVVSHVSDVWRVDLMLKYGGIYMDTDAVFVKPLDRDIRAYDAVGSYDWTYWNHPFPDTINFGIAIGKRNATFWHIFQESMKWFLDNDWAWNGLRQPYKIKERHPELVKIDPRLQVICFEEKCHPTWWPNYHRANIHHKNSNSLPNWRNDTYAFHWTLPTPKELLNEENLMRNNGIFGQIGKYILEKAGLLESVKRQVAAKIKL